MPRTLLPLVGLVAAFSVSAQWFGPSPYLGFADSPFSSGGYSSYFHLENFEDGLLNSPGLTITPVSGPGFVYTNPFNGDSVDEDDGAIDGSGLGRFSYHTPVQVFNVGFSAGVLGQLPTDVGFVWTDGMAGTLTVRAYNGSNSLISMLLASVGTLPNSYIGETDEDRFIGFRSPSGISRLEVTVNPAAGIEMDHVQYGFTPVTTPVPESSTWTAGALLAALGAATGLHRRRNRSAAA
jgi:hypothetical protein